MSKLQELLNKYSSEGVKYQDLGNLVDILDNLRKPVARDKREAGEIPYYGANGIQGYVKDYLFDGTYLLMGEDGSVINPDRSPVLNWVTGKIWVNNHAHVLSERPQVALLRYIYYALQMTDISNVVRGVPPKINQANMRAIKLPVPALEVQREIVSILDKFMLLGNELEAELEARKIQRSHVLDELRNGNLPALKSVPIVPLSEIVNFENGKPHEPFVDPEGDCELITAKFVSSNGTLARRIHRVDIKTLAQINDITIVLSDLPNGKALAKCYFVKQNDRFAVNQRIAILRSKDPRVADPEYLYHYVNRNPQILKFDDGSTQTHLKKANVVDMMVHLPSIEVQRRIAKSLSNLETFILDSSSGLTAEIIARQRQYEHYRARLFTFRELGVA